MKLLNAAPLGLLSPPRLLRLFLTKKKTATAEHLQNVSVTIRSEGSFSNGEGSGVVFTRKDSKGNLVNFVWTAAHVIDNLRKERKAVIEMVVRKLLLSSKTLCRKRNSSRRTHCWSIANGRRSLKVFRC